MPQSSDIYRGRFAPSPSGPLHFGSLVAAVGSYLDARHHSGEWLVRMEDLDPPREQPGAADDILRTLEAFGFEWDGVVAYQSQRNEAYQEALELLLDQGWAYHCACTRSEIAQAGVQSREGIIYPGTCRPGLPHGKRGRAIRLRTDRQDSLCFKDRILGEQTQNLETAVGDFVIRRADGLFAYQLAVVVDDAWQGINQIVRGADLLPSTPRQLHLLSLLQLTAPGYAHLPLVVDKQGRKLSKQAKSMPVTQRNPTEALYAALEFLGQTLPNSRSPHIKEFWQWAIENWDIKQIPHQQHQIPSH